MSEKQRKMGRPRLSRLELARRAAVRAKRRLDAAELAVNELLSARDHESSDERARIDATYEEKLEVARKLAISEAELKALRRELASKKTSRTKTLKAKIEAKRNATDRLRIQYRDLPPPGTSKERWAELPDFAKKAPPGRPRDDALMSFVKARIGLDEELQRLRELERKEGVEHASLDELDRTIPENKAGRPSGGHLVELDRRLARAERRIRIIQEDEKLDAETKQQRLDAAKERAAEIERAIAELEIKMSYAELLQRRLTVLRRQKQSLIIKYRQSGKDLSEIDEKLEKMTRQISDLSRIVAAEKELE